MAKKEWMLAGGGAIIGSVSAPIATDLYNYVKASGFVESFRTASAYGLYTNLSFGLLSAVVAVVAYRIYDSMKNNSPGISFSAWIVSVFAAKAMALDVAFMLRSDVETVNFENSYHQSQVMMLAGSINLVFGLAGLFWILTKKK